MKNAKHTTLICGLISIAATIIFYLFTFDNIFTISMRWVSLLFLLLTEIIGTLKVLFVKKDIVSQASVITSVVHLVAVFGLSVLFVNVFPFSIKNYILLNILLLCVLAVVDLIILNFGKNSAVNDRKLAQNQGVMLACLEKTQGLVVVYAESAYKKDLVEIADLIKYSDNSELTEDEIVIMNKLGELENQLKTDGENVTALITEIKNQINLRTIKVKSMKRGGY